MINAIEIRNALVTRINAFRISMSGPGFAVALPILAVPVYHDPETVPADKLLISVYPLTRRKSRLAKRGTTRDVTVFCALQCKTKPSETDKLDALIAYAEALDDHLDEHAIADTEPVISDDETFLWLPNFLHRNNVFVSLIERRYRWGATYDE